MLLPSYFANNDIDKVLKAVTMGVCEEAEGEYECFVNLYQNALFHYRKRSSEPNEDRHYAKR